MTRLEKLTARVQRAAAELDATEFPPTTGPYFTLAGWSYDATLAERIDLATAIYLHGNAAMRGSRCFDNCFEMGDGRAVARELTRRARANPTLHERIAQDFGGTFPAQWTREAEKPELAL